MFLKKQGCTTMGSCSRAGVTHHPSIHGLQRLMAGRVMFARLLLPSTWQKMSGKHYLPCDPRDQFGPVTYVLRIFRICIKCQECRKGWSRNWVVRCALMGPMHGHAGPLPRPVFSWQRPSNKCIKSCNCMLKSGSCGGPHRRRQSSV